MDQNSEKTAVCGDVQTIKAETTNASSLAKDSSSYYIRVQLNLAPISPHALVVYLTGKRLYELYVEGV